MHLSYHKNVQTLLPLRCYTLTSFRPSDHSNACTATMAKELMLHDEELSSKEERAAVAFGEPIATSSQVRASPNLKSPATSEV